MVLAVGLIAIVDAGLVMLVFNDSESAWPLVPLAVLSVMAGFSARRWWAIALAYALLFVFVPLHSVPERQELSMLGWMVLGAVPTAASQAALIAAGVGIAKLVASRSARPAR